MTKIFSIWRFVIMLGWAKSGTWWVTNDRESRTLYLSIHKVDEAGSDLSALGIIILPLSITIGFAKSSPQK